MLLLCATVACGGDITNDVAESAIGTWGGPEVSITVTAQGATAQFVCAHGAIAGPILEDASGNFSANGTYDFEHTSLIAGQSAVDSHLARYDGQISGTTMRVSVTLLDTKQTFGAYEAKLGSAGPSSRCQ